ncbi:ATP-dependent Clp protease ATP-binding subunit [Pseudonocardia sp. CA-107938]|uniref:ATP-dependent Clp protease ATP-binding subunit n=1 Tax=Pseudonocardia sp. CA-107938 TaxID=3240021 RepID=UPI003D92BB7C
MTGRGELPEGGIGGPFGLGGDLSDQARVIVSAALDHSASRGIGDMDTHHLLWAAATQCDTTRSMLVKAGADPDALAAEAGDGERAGQPLDSVPTLSPAAKRALLDSHRISRALGADHVDAEHLLIALAENQESGAGQILMAADATADALQRAVIRVGQDGSRLPATVLPAESETPTLDQCSHDLTELARRGKLDPTIGRDEQIEQIIEVLSRRNKNNPVLIGERGVGKTAIVEGLARRVAAGDVPDPLARRRVVQLDLSGMGTKDADAHLAKVLGEIREYGEGLVVFLPDLHTLISASGGDIGNQLKPALLRGELHIIGATSPEDYRRHVEKVPSLANSFQPIAVPEPTVEETVAILHGLRDRYEAHHQVRIGYDALATAARLAHRYIADRFLPDKAIDLVDRAGARARLRRHTPTTNLRELERTLERLVREKDDAVATEQYELASALRDEVTTTRGEISAARATTGGIPEVGARCVADVVAQTTGIPVEQLVHSERSRLQGLDEVLRARVVGQDAAIATVCEAIRRSRAGLTSSRRPIGSFLFLGPTGVGKSELARVLAKALFGTDDRLVRLDMSGFTDAASAARLIGIPLGSTATGDAGYLTEAVRRRPYSVLLLEQVDKVHTDVFSALLRILDEGQLVDGLGRTVDFRNTVVIMTSGVAVELLTTSTGLGFGAKRLADDPDNLEGRVYAKLRERFRPEFLNRLDEIVVFQPLTGAQLRNVATRILDETRSLLADQDITIDFAPAALDWITERGQHDHGARRLRRTIQREVDNGLSELLLSGRLEPGQHVTVEATDGQPQFVVRDVPPPTA